MAKSNYPNKLDTSVEIPVIRDNITEIGSDVLNSLRSAIFNIEKTLGINPQGSSGNSVASRINRSLDDNGNIIKESLDRAGVLSGPISNEDVSKVAGISESKLSLNFPTELLQNQISIIEKRMALFIASLEELNLLLSSHVHPSAKNRHFAKAIAVEEVSTPASSSATMSLKEQTLQKTLEELYSSHINYSGEGISDQNNSHDAGQIYYDNSNSLEIISSDDVQGAIDEIAGGTGASLLGSIMNLNSNGLIRTGKTFDAFSGDDRGSELIPSSEIRWEGPSGSTRELISFISQPTPAGTISPFDVLTILDSPNSSDNRDYIIEKVNLTSEDNLKSVSVFGGPKFPLEFGINAKITKRTYTVYNENGLNCSSRPRYFRSNTPDVQVANPNSATIISSGIRPNNIINGTSNILGIEIDGTPYDIDLYNPDFSSQTVDTIVDKINQHVVENKLNIFAYKVRALRCYELAISHILPNFKEDSSNRTLKIIDTTQSAHNALGLGYILDREVEGLSGNTCHINGRLITSFGNLKKYSSENLKINIGTLNLVSSQIDFLNEGIRIGDLCTIEGSSDTADDGTYRIHSVDANTVTLDSTGATFAGELSESSNVFIQRCTAPVGELEFEILDGMYIIDVFMTEDGDINYAKRAEVGFHLQDADFYAIVTDFSKGYISDGYEVNLIVDSSGYARISDTNGVFGDPLGEAVYVASTGRYKVFSPDKFNYIVLDVQGSTPPAVDKTVNITGVNEIRDDVFHLSRINYSTEFGFILGSPADSGGGIPKVHDKRTTGTIDDTIISENILERYIQGPRNELRGSGFIRDLDIKEVTYNGDGTCSVSVNPGVAVVNGVRVEYFGINNTRYDFNTPDRANFYVAIDGKGCLLIEPEMYAPDLALNLQDSDYSSPFISQNVATIAYIEVDTSEVEDPIVLDQRFFIDHIDYKLIGELTVANDKRFGHFTDLGEAVKYSRRFHKIFPEMSRPSIKIKEGTYDISETITIDFDIQISGSGPQTVLQRSGALSVGESDATLQPPPVIYIGGGTYENPKASVLIRMGVTLRDFSYKVREETLTEGAGTAILVGQSIDGITGFSFGGGPTTWSGGSKNAFFAFENIRFSGEKLGAHDGTFTYYEEAIQIGKKNLGSSSLYGNIRISNCFFDWMGGGYGPCRIWEFNEYKNILVTSNMATNVYGDSGVQSGSSYGILYTHNLDPTQFSDVTGDGIKLAGIVETGNYSDDQ
jgi:hypothetical protein|tara:strand:+ start:1929 stop:5606 length:3678 start_codon:yes stop_codon:yes gene_type:complete